MSFAGLEDRCHGLSSELLSGTMSLSKKGRLSYKQGTVKFVSINDTLTCRIERVNNDIARVSFENAEGQGVPAPENIRMDQSDGTPNPPMFNGFLISWVGSYMMYVNTRPTWS